MVSSHLTSGGRDEKNVNLNSDIHTFNSVYYILSRTRIKNCVPLKFITTLHQFVILLKFYIVVASLVLNNIISILWSNLYNFFYL